MKYLKILILLTCAAFLDVCGTEESRLVKSAAIDFRKNYCRDYIVEADIEKTVFSADSCIQHLHVAGLWASFGFHQKDPKVFYQDKYRVGRFLPLEVQAEDLLVPGSGQALVPLSINTGYDYNSYLTSYRDNLDELILLHKRAVELYGPLNPKKTALYSYRRLEKTDSLTAISFTVKKGFPRKTRISGNGVLLLNGSGQVAGFRIRNLEDRYSNHSRVSTSNRMPRVTGDTLEVEYGRSQEQIWTSRVGQKVRWVEPESKSWSKYYYAETAPYRNPFKNKISTEQKIVFHSPVMGRIVKEVEAKEVFPRENLQGPELPYVQTGDSLTRLFMEKILDERRQHLRRAGLSEQKEEEEIRQSLKAQEKAMELYQFLYGAEYNYHF